MVYDMYTMYTICIRHICDMYTICIRYICGMYTICIRCVYECIRLYTVMTVFVKDLPLYYKVSYFNSKQLETNYIYIRL